MNKKIVNYDPEADVLALYLSKGAEEEFVEVAPNVSVELDKKGKVIGIEILNASKVLKPTLKPLQKKALVSAGK
jgi:uncharacterized protein YuzE